MRRSRTLLAVVLIAIVSLPAAGCQGAGPAWLPPGLFPRAALSQQQMESAVRSQFRDSRIDTLELEQLTLRGANESRGFDWHDRGVSDDELVYIATVRGRLKPFWGSTGFQKGNIGASEPWTEEMVMLISAYDGTVRSARGKPFIQENAGFTVVPAFKDTWQLGERLTLTTRGEPIEGLFTITLTNPATGERSTRSVLYRKAATFAWPLDALNLPGYQAVATQTFEVAMDFSDGQHYSSTIHVTQAGPEPAASAASR